MVRKQRSLYPDYYFQVVDSVAGPMVLRVGSFLRFSLTDNLNGGHNFIKRQLNRPLLKENPSKTRPVQTRIHATTRT
jgi:hypothetical protein